MDWIVIDVYQGRYPKGYDQSHNYQRRVHDPSIYDDPDLLQIILAIWFVDNANIWCYHYNCHKQLEEATMKYLVIPFLILATVGCSTLGGAVSGLGEDISKAGEWIRN